MREENGAEGKTEQTGAAYIRVSTEEQMEFSPDSQIKKIREYARNHGILLPEEFIFVDVGISGRSAKKRPAFMNMISQAKSRPFDVILLWKFSRFARNRQDSILYKSMLRKECGVEVISITEQLSDDPTAILIEALLEAMDEYYSINLAQEVRRGMNEKFSRGGVVSIPPFGYKMGEQNFEMDKHEAPFVRLMFQRFIEGASYRQIAADLNRMGVQSIRGGLFENRTVEYILSNPVYIGKFRRNVNGGDLKDRFRRGENMVIVSAKHEPLISEETFLAAQNRKEDISMAPSKSASASYADFMLRGLVRCSSCGSTLTGTAGGKAFQCHKYARGACQRSHYVTQEKLNQAVLEKIEEDIGDKVFTVDRKKRTARDLGGDIKTLCERERQRLDRMKSAYQAGIDSLEEYRAGKAECMERICALEKEMRNPVSEIEMERKEVSIRMMDVIWMLKSDKVGEDDKNEILRSFITKILFCRKEGTIRIYYHL